MKRFSLIGYMIGVVIICLFGMLVFGIINGDGSHNSAPNTSNKRITASEEYTLNGYHVSVFTDTKTGREYMVVVSYNGRVAVNDLNTTSAPESNQ